ncbi:kinesin-like protein KIF12 isoform X2 [Alosa alosa]|uniref:kinesin-like protein KIF12 isoform X2 n=1 Tax=Alosa alosa TaxID=278164 RepID=UPI002015529C|nr:kinesin-like protein KIF12 isoform X2 [Alosa alosa]
MERHAESKVIVAVRVRPLSEDEQERNEESIVFCPDEHNLLVSQEGLVERAFSFNMVFRPECSQQEIFQTTGMRKLIDMAIEGYTCTVFAFGQTGSGKTYTITGPHSLFSEDSQESELEGLMQRSVAYLLERVQHSDELFQLCASYSEIYNEQVRDLLNPWLTYSLAVRGSTTSGFYVENLSVVEFCNLEGFMTLLERGMQNRQSSSQTQNEHSSRSHSILTLYIKHTLTGAEPVAVARGKLCIVDLARGSERVKDRDSDTEKLLEETGNINRSLLTLGKCITALVDPKKRTGHIPYRDSKLTMLLSDSLGGEGITLMIACVSPTAGNLQETMNTLRYSSKAKRIKNKPVAKSDLREQILASLQKEIRILKEENMTLRQHLPKFQEELESGASGSCTGSTDGTVEPVYYDERSESTGSDAGLMSLLQDLKREIDKLQKDKRLLLDKQESSDQQRECLSQENVRLLRKLRDLERVICSSPHSNSSYSGISLDNEASSGNSPQCVQNPTVPQQQLPPDQSPSQPPYTITYCCTCSVEAHQQGQGCPQLLERLALHEDSYGAHHLNPQKLPLIQDGDAARHPRAVEGGKQPGREPPGEEPAYGACPPQRRRSQVEKRGYAERFQGLLEARGKKAQSVEMTAGRPQQGDPGLPLLVKKRGETS